MSKTKWYAKSIYLLVALALALAFMVPAVPVGAVTDVATATATPAVASPAYDSSLVLDNKTDFGSGGAWNLTPGDGIGGVLQYKSSGHNFNFSFNATGLANDNYSLIYYADYSGDRYGTWGGDNPGALIGTGAASGGSLTISGSKELNMDLPCPPDANISEHSYCGSPDFYTNCHGAKIWLVPSSALSSGPALPVTAWPPDNNWLFETNLIWYDDTDTLILENKDAAWAVIEDTTQGTLQYNPSGPTFDFTFTATVPEDREYSLIYYADREDRFTNWGGDNPGALIGTGTASGGSLTISGSKELNMDLPCPPDFNISVYDYSGDPDYYPNAHGAKIWLVPSNCYDASACKVTTWSPDKFLFETDLIWYDDTGQSTETATGTGDADFSSDAGALEGLTSVAEDTLPPDEGKPDLEFPHGFFSFNITGLTPCAHQTVVVTITLPEDVPVGTEYWKYHESEGWIDVTSLLGDNDGDDVLTLTLTDGELGDDDGECNGIIVDQGGPGIYPVPVGGEVYPVNKLAILAPWIALAMAIIAGSFMVTRRRRAQS